MFIGLFRGVFRGPELWLELALGVGRWQRAQPFKATFALLRKIYPRQ
jgi:hypothetical protein